MENVRNIIESLLFVSDTPLTIEKLKTVIETADTKEIRDNLNALADHYEARGGGFRLCEVAGGWQLRTRSKYHEYIKRMLQPAPQRLSRAALETLAIVAYNQPIIRADIEHIRGVDCGGMLRQLLERKLIRVLGRKEIPGRPLIYATSKLFLELFELKNLKDLPTPKEIEEMGTMAANDGAKPTSVDQKHGVPMPSEAMGKTETFPSPLSPAEHSTESNFDLDRPTTSPHTAQKTEHQAKSVKRRAHLATGFSPVSTKPYKIEAFASKISSTPAAVSHRVAKIQNQKFPCHSKMPTVRKNEMKQACQSNNGKLKKP